MNSEPGATESAALVRGWATLICPAFGMFISALWFDVITSSSPVWLTIIAQIDPWPYSAWGQVVKASLVDVLVFLPILLIAGGLIGVTNWIPLLEPIAHAVRHDWSLLSFVLYGAAYFPVVIAGDEYRGLGGYQLASLAVLAGGALVYGRLGQSWSRLLTLVGALGLALGGLAFGRYDLYSQQAWAAYTSFPRWWEAASPLLPGAALALLMSAPAGVVKLFHQPTSTT